MKNAIDRKQFLKQFGLAGVAAVGASSLLAACGGGSESQSNQQASGDPCRDTTGLSEQDMTMRRNLNYIDDTERPEERCDNCALYKKPENGGCGGCLLFAGPVTPQGWCSSWVTNNG